eukprot:527170-Amorphochlora_amoeboformis.AAC.1
MSADSSGSLDLTDRPRSGRNWKESRPSRGNRQSRTRMGRTSSFHSARGSMEGKSSGALPGGAGGPERAGGKGPRDVTNSLAFMMLQKLVNERKIREHEAENYRNLYRKLNDKVIDVYENETRLYTFNTKLQRQLVDLRRSLEEKNKNILQMKAKCEELKMKKDQMQEKVEAKVLEVKVVDNELKSCRDDKRDKEGNLEHIIKCSEDAARPMIEDFNRKLRDCTEEIKLQNENSVKENEARELYLDEIEKLKMQIEDLHRDKLEKRRVLSQNFNKPDRIRAEADVFSRERAKKEKEALTLLQKIQTLKSQVAEKTTKRDKVKLHVDHYKQKITRHRGLLGKKANNLADLERKMETQKLKNMELLMRRQALGIEIEDQRSKCQAVHRRMKRHQSTNRNELRRCENLRRKYETINAIIPSMIDQVIIGRKRACTLDV